MPTRFCSFGVVGSCRIAFLVLGVASILCLFAELLVACADDTRPKEMFF